MSAEVRARTSASGAPPSPDGHRRTGIFLNVLKGVLFLAKRFPRSVAAVTLLAAISGFIPALNAWVAKKIIDDVVERLRGSAPAANVRPLVFWLAAGLVLGVAGALIRWRQSVSQDWLQRAGAVEMDRVLVDRTQAIDVLTRESPEFADRQMLVQMGTGALSSNLLMSTITIGQTLMTMASFAVLLTAFSPGLALLGIAVGLSFGFVEVRYSRQRYLLGRALIKLRRRLVVTRQLLTNPAAVHEIKRAGTYDRLRSRLLEQGGEARDREHGLERTTHRRRAALNSAEAAVSFGVYGALLWRLIKGAITLGDVTLYRSAFSMLSGGVQAIGRAGSALLESDMQLQHLFEFLEPPAVETPPCPVGTVAFPDALEKGVEVRGLGFRYPNMDRPVFENLSLDLPPGRVTAIVGPNGCGKTTLLKLLAAVYPSDADAVLLEGRRLAEYAPDDYLDHVFMWGVTSLVHPLTVRENVALCRLGEAGDDDRVWEAIRRAGAEEIVARLPKGIDTMMTRMLDDGQQLSWGQSMRIVLARALFTGARIILIDEPGVGLDAGSRKYLLELLPSLRDDRIVVVASHDRDVVEVADRVVELKPTV